MLPNRAKIGAFLIGPLLLVWTTYETANAIIPTSRPSLSILFSSILFLVQVLILVSYLGGVCWRPHIFMAPSTKAVITLAILGSIFLFVEAHVPDLDFLFAISIVVAATCEEIVFRRVLPNALAKSIEAQSNQRRAAIYAIALAQGAFATCHFVIGHDQLLELASVEWVRLFAAGLIYSELVAVLGLWATSMIHATSNVLPDLFHESFNTPPLLLIAFAAFLAAILLLSRFKALRYYDSAIRPPLQGNSSRLAGISKPQELR